jgi:signal transduction histidine kinase
MIRFGVPALAVAMLVAAAIVAWLAPDAGQQPAPLALGVVAVAIAPWAWWLVHGDDGPTWTNNLLMMLPVLALGIGYWFVEALSLGSGAAYPLVLFPVLLVVILGIAVAEDQATSTAMAAAAAVASGAPLLAALLAGKGVDIPGLMTWIAAFALSVVAGWAAQTSYRANRAVSAAREALARQEAAEERRRIARDVHDVVAHTLSVTMLHITAARMAMNREETATAIAALEEAERQGRASLADIRRMVRLLRSDDASALEAAQPGLADVEALVGGYRAAGLPVTLHAATGTSSSSPGAELALYRVLQEALANASRHGTGEVAVKLDADAAGLRLRVDNPWRPTEARSRGSGLAGMRERIAAAGGTIEAGVRDGRWVVQAIIPGDA